MTITRQLQIFLLIALTLTTAGSLACGRQRGHQREVTVTQGTNPGRGLRVLSVYEGSEAERAGLQPMDLLTRAGEFEIIDNSSYFRAREFHLKSGKPFEIVYWRGPSRYVATVSEATLGFEANEYNPVIYQFDSIVDRVNAMREVPEYLREVEFKEAFTEPAEKVLDEAKALLDRAEKEGKMTPSEILVARIYLIFDDASPDDLKKQSALLDKFIATEPEHFVYYAGEKKFLEKNRYRAAIRCFKHHLEVEPDDISTRLNLGYAAYHIGLWEEAEAAADYVLKDPDSLSDHGRELAFQVKAMGALGRQDYTTSISFAERSIQMGPDTFAISMVQLAAVQSGDLRKLADASMQFQQLLPGKYDQNKLQMDAIEAYALVKQNQRQQAKALVLKWRGADRVEGKIARYWQVYPGGADVLKNWKALSQ